MNILPETFCYTIPQEILGMERVVKSYENIIENMFDTYTGFVNELFQEYCYYFLKDNKYIQESIQLLIDFAFAKDLEIGTNEICEYVERNFKEDYERLRLLAIENGKNILSSNIKVKIGGK